MEDVGERKIITIKSIKLFQFLLKYYFSLKSNLSTVVRTQNKRCTIIPDIKQAAKTHQIDIQCIFNLWIKKKSINARKSFRHRTLLGASVFVRWVQVRAYTIYSQNMGRTHHANDTAAANQCYPNKALLNPTKRKESHIVQSEQSFRQCWHRAAS